MKSMDSAIRYAEAKHLEYNGDTHYADQNPCKTVYRLVRQLLGQDNDLNEELNKKCKRERNVGGIFPKQGKRLNTFDPEPVLSKWLTITMFDDFN